MRYSAKGMHSSTFCFSNSHRFLKKMLNVNEVVKSGKKWHLESIAISCMKTGSRCYLETHEDINIMASLVVVGPFVLHMVLSLPQMTFSYMILTGQ